jgi:carbonic anhydrase
VERLFKGTVKFREISYQKNKELYERLNHGQTPHTLFVGCSDSRVVPGLITRSLPGELFVVRNVANIVPPYRVSPEYASTTSAIEYAVNALNVENIVVCGHSNCGGCAALFYEKEKLENLPNVSHWLEQVEGLRNEILFKHPNVSPERRSEITEQLNIVKQMANLLSYPYIREKYEKGEINIYGWYYIIGTGEVYNFNKDNGEFELIQEEEEE